jgi:hypothetical protein
MFRFTSMVSIASMVISTALSAQVTFYNNQTAFTNAAGPLSGFEGFNDVRPAAPSHNYGPFIIAETGGINAVVTTGTNPAFNSATIEGSGSIWYDDNGASQAVFTFVNPINAFGIWTAVEVGGQMTASGGAWTNSFALTANQPSFWGVISTTSFTTVTFDMGGAQNVGFDALRFGVPSTTVVPEPQTWAMVLVGIAAMAMRNRRRANDRRAVVRDD